MAKSRRPSRWTSALRIHGRHVGCVGVTPPTPVSGAEARRTTVCAHLIVNTAARRSLSPRREPLVPIEHEIVVVAQQRPTVRVIEPIGIGCKLALAPRKGSSADRAYRARRDSDISSGRSCEATLLSFKALSARGRYASGQPRMVAAHFVAAHPSRRGCDLTAPGRKLGRAGCPLPSSPVVGPAPGSEFRPGRKPRPLRARPRPLGRAFAAGVTDPNSPHRCCVICGERSRGPLATPRRPSRGRWRGLPGEGPTV
jgi:hypothetical protein